MLGRVLARLGINLNWPIPRMTPIYLQGLLKRA